jgi:RNA polymerase sigma-70 factor (ECF subfamily)
MSTSASSREAPRRFPHTRWSLVLAATRKNSIESAAALEAICRTYWQPLYAYVRCCGHSHHDAQDLTQEFFRRLLEKRWLDSAARERGKLRTFLIVALKHFMSNQSRSASAQRRGGGQTHVPFDTAFAETGPGTGPDTSQGADQTFDREWALTLLNLTVERLRTQFTPEGRPADFDALKDCLMAARGTIDYTALAAKLNLSEGAARVAAHRLRKRFREIYREEISQTLSDGADLEGELRHLAAVLARQ